MKDYLSQISQYLSSEMSVLNELSYERINIVINVLENARITGKRIFTCGNGGSAATAAHFVCDLEKGASEGKEVRFDAECLSDNAPVVMAIANDCNYDDIFAERLKNKGHSGDVLICISGSGNSENVIRAVEMAKRKNITTIGLVGYDGGRIKPLVDHCIHVKIDDMQIVEDVHVIINHIIMSVLSRDN